MGRVVIAIYRPLPGKEIELRQLVARHVPELRQWGLATDRPPLLLQAADGSLVEIFEWQSAAAIERAHHDARVQALWAEFAACSDFVRPADLAESQTMFPDFTPLA